MDSIIETNREIIPFCKTHGNTRNMGYNRFFYATAIKVMWFIRKAHSRQKGAVAIESTTCYSNKTMKAKIKSWRHIYVLASVSLLC